MPPEPWCSKMQLGILKPLDTDESLSLTKVSLRLDLEAVSWSVFFRPDELKPSDCHRRTVLLASQHLMSFVSKHELKLLDRDVKTIKDPRGSIFIWWPLPYVLLYWAWEGSGTDQKSCDWFRCRWETAFSQWHTGSRLSSPDPRRMELVLEREGKKKAIIVWAPVHACAHAGTRSNHKNRKKGSRWASLWWDRSAGGV